jgi:predicted amidophosphoribosyltransferase
MALVPCPACNHQISTSAASCPNCGHPLKPNGDTATNVVGKVATVVGVGMVASWVARLLAVIAICAVFIVLILKWQ